MLWVRTKLDSLWGLKERRNVVVIEEHEGFIDQHELYGLNRIFVGRMICTFGLHSAWGCKLLKGVEWWSWKGDCIIRCAHFFGGKNPMLLSSSELFVHLRLFKNLKLLVWCLPFLLGWKPPEDRAMSGWSTLQPSMVCGMLSTRGNYWPAPRGQIPRKRRAWTLQVGKTGYKFDLSGSLPVWPWASYLTPLILSFFICKTRLTLRGSIGLLQRLMS